MQEAQKKGSKNPFYENPELQAIAENKIREMMFTLREETECDLTSCHMAMLIGCFNVMRKFSVDEVMFTKMYERTISELEQIFAKVKKETHENPGVIQ